MPQEELIQAQAMEQLHKLYSVTAVDHILHPRNTGALDSADGFARVSGPCGDTIEIWLKVANGCITGASFAVDGCAATVACGSAVTEIAQSKSIPEARQIRQQDVLDALGGLPEANRHCALLAANSLQEALKDCQAMRREPWKKSYRRY